MNKNKLYLILFSLSILIGCKDAIDIDQPGRLNDEAAFESVADLKTGLYWLYNGLDASQYIAFSAVYTDEVAVGKDNGGQSLSNLNFVEQKIKTFGIRIIFFYSKRQVSNSVR